MKTRLVAFHGDAKLKADLVEEIRRHRTLDMIVQGTYGQENGQWRGCAIGCSIHSLNIIHRKNWSTGDHSVYEGELGIPLAIARLEDSIFEKLPAAKALDFPLRFMEAIPVGADLSGVAARFLHWLLVDDSHGVIWFALEEHKPIIRRVADLYARQTAGEDVATEEFEAARAEAVRAARGCGSLRRAIVRAAWAAEAAEAAAVADQLIDLLRSAPIVTDD